MSERYGNLYILRLLQGHDGFTKNIMEHSIRILQAKKFAYLNYRSIAVREHGRDRVVRCVCYIVI